MKNDTPLISVVMATYNEPVYMVKEAIESILNQSWKNIELLIYDDSQNTDTIEAIDSYKCDDRVHIFREDRRVGFVPSLNKGLKHAKGKYIARMDGDDISQNNRFEIEMEYLRNHPNVAIVGGQLNIIDENGNQISSRKYPEEGFRLRIYSTVRCPLAHPTVMFRRQVVDDGFLYDEKLKSCEDLDLWLRLLNKSYQIANVPQTMVNYRVTKNFTDKRSNRKQLENVAFVRRKNFSKEHIFYSIISCITAWLFLIVPKSILNKAYNAENKR